jgi:hypothetical protein
MKLFAIFFINLIHIFNYIIIKFLNITQNIYFFSSPEYKNQGIWNLKIILLKLFLDLHTKIRHHD